MSKFVEFINHRFGIALPKGFCVEERKNNVYILCSDILKVDYGRMQRKGMLAGKLNTLYGIKPSLNFVLQFGHLASKNFIDVGMRDLHKAYSNIPIQTNCESCSDGLVILKTTDGKGAGISLKKGTYLKPLIPKSRLIAHEKRM